MEPHEKKHITIENQEGRRIRIPANRMERLTILTPPRGLLDPRLRVTVALTLLNTLILVLTVVVPAPDLSFQTLATRLLGDLDRTLLKSGAFAGCLIEAGDYWRLCASVFLHQGVVHLILNMVALFIFSFWIETLLRRQRFLVLYLFSGVMGNLFGYMMHVLEILFVEGEVVPYYSVGASGAVFGVAGAMLAADLMARGSLSAFMNSRPSRWVAGYLLMIIFLGFLMPSVDGWAHVGGFLAGCSLGLFYFSRLRMGASPRMIAAGQNAFFGLMALTALALFISVYPPRTSDLYNDRAIYMMESAIGRPDLAVAWVRKKSRVSDTAAYWLRNEARLEVEMNPTRAGAIVDALLTKRPRDAMGHYLRGRINWRQEDYTQAEAAYRQAMVLALEKIVEPQGTTVTALTAPATPTVTLAILDDWASTPTATPFPLSPDDTLPDWFTIAEISHAEMLLKLGRAAEAHRGGERMARRLLARAEGLVNLAADHRRRAQDAGLLEQAAMEAQADMLDQMAAVLRNQVAWMYAVLGFELDQALTIATQALSVLPDPSLYDTRGWIYYRKGQYLEALGDLHRAQREMREPNGEILYHLAAVLIALDRKEEAREFLRQSIELPGGFDGMEAAKALYESTFGPVPES